MKITYQSNAGILINGNDITMAVDLLCESGELLYTPTPDTIVDAVINRKDKYSQLDYMLYTHGHFDHFHVKSIEKYFSHENMAKLMMPEQAKNKLKAERIKGYQDWIFSFDLRRGEKYTMTDENVRITAIPFFHEGKEAEREDNVGYLIEAEGKKILHVGDAAIDRTNYHSQNLQEENIDLLIVPFPYITRKDGRAIIEEYIKPQKIAVVHLPHKNKDFCGWNKAADRGAEEMKTLYEDITVFHEIDHEIEL